MNLLTSNLRRMLAGCLPLLMLSFFASALKAETVAYWRFDEGPANGAVQKTFGAADSSGNGNHLDPGTQAGQQGLRYKNETPYPSIPQSGAENSYSIKNTGSSPSLETRSQDSAEGPGSLPAGIDIETITPSQFTIEAFFKPEDGGYRTVVGRDAVDVIGGNSNLSALYFQIRPDDSVAIVYADVSGYQHIAESPSDMIDGFDFSSDPQGQNGRWYYMAAINDGSTLSLYLANITAGTDPFLVGQADLTESPSPDRSLTAGTQSGQGWHTGAWSVGRGMYDAQRTDRCWGYIDEVRISTSALSLNELLMTPNPSTKRNPLFDGADPHIMLTHDKAWIYPTSGFPRRFYTYSSSDMVNWSSRQEILNFNQISWIPSGKYAWAPCIIEKDNTYYFYYSVGPKPSHIGVAHARRPNGRFTDKGSALLSDNGSPGFEAIDPMVFEDPVSGKFYFYAGGSAGSKLRVFELNDDMLSFKQEINVDNPPNFTEGAFMHYRSGVYYLSYSNGRWNNSSYSIHYCASDSPLGPWNYQGELASSQGWFKGPGHHSFVHNKAVDEWCIVYHRWNEHLDDGPYSGSRSVCIEKIEYDGDQIKPIILTDTGIEQTWTGSYYRADFNFDGQVNASDLMIFTGDWLSSNYICDTAPVGGDGAVNKPDFSFFASQWIWGN
ncbi:Xylosidase/arabinosidase [Sedimentisphaera cyanobacteriorum]|uniref:Xylosidase/arabinosidase n=1 Tax=Sedimentisphaera cyanobacteriorum TaxID=1940790 RepID=A0A1Q2HQY4_9BACT|nr:family 43 glycosylhydrolase [Sedimentisphaera cyanobacteriorum]AQQ09800.1 Xylosidase/arabinosidase [Sedimentisphaera cyanobacteriorum]